MRQDERENKVVRFVCSLKLIEIVPSRFYWLISSTNVPVTLEERFHLK